MLRHAQREEMVILSDSEESVLERACGEKVQSYGFFTAFRMTALNYFVTQR